MLLVPLRALGTLGGTYFLDVKKVIFSIKCQDAALSLKRSMDLGAVSLKLPFPHAHVRIEVTNLIRTPSYAVFKKNCLGILSYTGNGA